MPKVSIIIAVYNVQEYLKQCLDSVINQTLQDIEIICVNDGSIDNSLKILEEYASKDSRFKIISQENQGPGVARNRAIEVATGDYLMILDPDDWLELNACELAYNQISKNQNDFVIFNAYKYYEKTNKKEFYGYRTEPFKNIIEVPQIDLSKLENDFIKAPYTTLQIYSMDFIKKNNIRYTNEKLSEDRFFWIKAVVSAESVSILKSPIYNYRIRTNSLTNINPKTWKYLFTTRYSCLKNLEKLNIKYNYIEAIVIHDINSLLYWLNKPFPNIWLKRNFYIELRKMFLYQKNKYDFSKIYNYINRKLFDYICNTPWEIHFIKIFLKNIFTITNENNHKLIIFLGIKIKIKKVEK